MDSIGVLEVRLGSLRRACGYNRFGRIRSFTAVSENVGTAEIVMEDSAGSHGFRTLFFSRKWRALEIWLTIKGLKPCVYDKEVRNRLLPPPRFLMPSCSQQGLKKSAVITV